MRDGRWGVIGRNVYYRYYNNLLRPRRRIQNSMSIFIVIAVQFLFHYIIAHTDKGIFHSFPMRLQPKSAEWKAGVEAEHSFHNCTSKRLTYISWDDYFIGIALLSSLRSKDPHKQVGACVVNPAKRIVGIGYNGFPQGCSDDLLPWKDVDNEDKWLNTKHPYIVPAETNAILNTCGETHGSTLYVTRFPCKWWMIPSTQLLTYLWCGFHSTRTFLPSPSWLNYSSICFHLSVEKIFNFSYIFQCISIFVSLNKIIIR
jgi:dCMP deaminase